MQRPDRTQIYGEALGELSKEASGNHDVVLVFFAPDAKPIGEFEYLRFERYRGELGLHPKEVKLEVRVGRKNGEKIGEVYPHGTGGDSTFRDFIGALEPAGGKQPLYFVIRSALTNSVGKLNWVRLDKASRIPGGF